MRNLVIVSLLTTIIIIGFSQKPEILKKEELIVSNDVMKLEASLGSSTNLFYRNADHLYLERFCIRYGKKIYTSENTYPLKNLRVLKGNIINKTRSIFSDDEISVERNIFLPPDRKWLIISYKIVPKRPLESIKFYQGVDFDVDATVNFDYGKYDELNDIAYIHEKTYVGISSPIKPSRHDLSTPYSKLWLHIKNDSLNNALKTNIDDPAIALQWDAKNVIKEFEIPVIFAVGNSLEELKENIEDGKKYVGKKVVDDRKIIVDLKEPVEVYQGEEVNIKIPVSMKSKIKKEPLHNVTLEFPPELRKWIVKIEPESLILESNKTEYFLVKLNIPPPFLGEYDFTASLKSNEGVGKDFQIKFIVRSKEEMSLFERAISLLLYFFR
ncbi:MAG: hypothetical protein ACE5K4_04590 [Candidatus Hydrothermarchaeota archaeon]